MKKVLAVASAIMILLTVAGCFEVSQEAAVPETTEAPAETAVPETEAEAAVRRAVTDPGKALRFPTVEEESLLIENDDLITLGRDGSCDVGANSGKNTLNAIYDAFPTEAVRKRSDDSFYLAYDTDTGVRVFLLFRDGEGENRESGFPVPVKNILSYADFAEIDEGDAIADVIAVDETAGLTEKEILGQTGLNSVGETFYEKEGFPITTVHYLTDGILKIEYKLHDNRTLWVKSVEYSEDYILTSPDGIEVNYKLADVDLPYIQIDE